MLLNWFTSDFFLVIWCPEWYSSLFRCHEFCPRIEFIWLCFRLRFALEQIVYVWWDGFLLKFRPTKVYGFIIKNSWFRSFIIVVMSDEITWEGSWRCFQMTWCWEGEGVWIFWQSLKLSGAFLVYTLLIGYSPEGVKDVR